MSEILAQILGEYTASAIPWAVAFAMKAGRVTSVIVMQRSLAVGVVFALTENVCAHQNFRGLAARCVMILVSDHSVSMIDISVQVWKWSMGSLWLLIAMVTMLVSAMLALWETTVRCVPPLLTPSQGQACVHTLCPPLCVIEAR